MDSRPSCIYIMGDAGAGCRRCLFDLGKDLSVPPSEQVLLTTYNNYSILPRTAVSPPRE